VAKAKMYTSCCRRGKFFAQTLKRYLS